MKFRGKLCAAFAAAALSISVSAGAEAPLPLEAYGDLPGIEDMAISPSGKGVAIAGRIKGKRTLLVLNSEHKIRAMAGLEGAKLRYIQWAGEDMVIAVTSVTENLGYGFVQDKYEFRAAILVPLTGGEPQVVFSRTRTIPNAIWGNYGFRKIDGKWMGYFGGLQLKRPTSGNSYRFVHGRPYLYAVDLSENKPHQIARAAAEDHDRDWIVDGNGNVAATLDISEKSGRWEIANGQRDSLISGIDPSGDVSLIGLGQSGNTVLYSTYDRDTESIRHFEVPLEGGAPTEIFKDVNFKRLYFARTNGWLLGYLEDGPSPKPVLFDAAKQQVLAKVYRAFPNQNARVVEWTPDFSHLLVHTSGNGDSGTWYLVDMAHLKADPVGNDRPVIFPERVGPISTVEYKASDGLELDGILTLPPGREAENLPVIMFPHGGPHAHDSEDFDWWAQAIASRGYAVFQPNFRGSDHRDLAFEKAGNGQWGRKMQTDISDGLAELARRGIVDPKRACIMGASYGGYAALAGVTLQSGLYRCSVAVAPVSDLKEMYDVDYRESGKSNLTRFNLKEDLGDPSTFSEVSPRRHAEQADAPILLIHGKDDTVVPFRQSDQMADALKDAGKPYEFVVLREEDHWLSRAETRKQMLEEAMRFIQKYNPAD